MPCSTAATFGAVALIRLLISSTPFTTYLFLQGEPNGFNVMQPFAMLEKPMSFPPMLIETTLVVESSELNWGGFGPSISTLWGCVMWSVLAPLQLGSRSESPMLALARCG